MKIAKHVRIQYALVLDEAEYDQLNTDPRRLIRQMKRARREIDAAPTQRQIDSRHKTNAIKSDGIKIECKYCHEGFAPDGVNNHITRSHPGKPPMEVPEHLRKNRRPFKGLPAPRGE